MRAAHLVHARALAPGVHEAGDAVHGPHLAAHGALLHVAGRHDDGELVARAVVLLRDGVVEEEGPGLSGHELHRAVHERDEKAVGRRPARLIEQAMPLHVANELLGRDDPGDSCVHDDDAILRFGAGNARNALRRGGAGCGRRARAARRSSCRSRRAEGAVRRNSTSESSVLHVFDPRWPETPLWARAERTSGRGRAVGHEVPAREELAERPVDARGRALLRLARLRLEDLAPRRRGTGAAGRRRPRRTRGAPLPAPRRAAQSGSVTVWREKSTLASRPDFALRGAGDGPGGGRSGIVVSAVVSPAAAPGAAPPSATSVSGASSSSRCASRTGRRPRAKPAGS